MGCDPSAHCAICRLETIATHRHPDPKGSAHPSHVLMDGLPDQVDIACLQGQVVKCLQGVGLEEARHLLSRIH